MNHRLIGLSLIFASAALAAPAVAADIQSAPAETPWLRPCLLVPELPAVPKIDGAQDEGVWDRAAAGAAAFPLGADRPSPADTEFRIGHRGGVLYLLLRYAWPNDQPPVAKAQKHDGAVWDDDGAELYFAPVRDLNHPRQLSFNLAGTTADAAGTRADPHTAHIDFVSPWNPKWEVACRREGASYLAELAIPLDQAVGVKGERGDVFRFTLVRNRVGHASPVLHWAPITGPLNCKPESMGFLVLAGSDPSALTWAALRREDRGALVFEEPSQVPWELVGSPFRLLLHNPVAHALRGKAAPRFTARLSAEGGEALAVNEALPPDWPQTLTLPAPPPAAPRTAARFELAEPGGGVVFSTPLIWVDDIFIAATDPVRCRAEGATEAGDYPRSVGQPALFLYGKGSRVTLSTAGTAVYLRLPPAFLAPGPWQGSQAGVKLRCRVDDRPWRELAILDSGREVPLAEDLSAGPHQAVVEVVEGWQGILNGFRVATKPLGGIHGRITTQDYAELLTDVRAEVFAGDRLVCTDYVRSPVNSTFDLLGLEPGTYRVRFTAAGWRPYEVKDVTIAQAGQKADLGVITLAPDPDVLAGAGEQSLGYGKTVNASPGQTFVAHFGLRGEVKSAQLVSRYKTVNLRVISTEVERSFAGTRIAAVSLEVPRDTPHDMYALKVAYASGRTLSLPQAVCLREPLPAAFHVVAIGHTNTWGQQTGEYLSRLGHAAELAGARVLLISNEVNPAYIAGALKDLRIPYLVTAGNHTLGRWDDFYGPRSHAYDDGPMRVVVFNGTPADSWRDAAALLAGRPEATNRVLLCYEAFPPAEVVAQGKPSLLWDGHSAPWDRDAYNERLASDAPGRPMHLGLGNDQQEFRWIAMTPDGLAPEVKTPADTSAVPMPRLGQDPLRVEFSAANDGSATALTARLTNASGVAFPRARVRLVLKAGSYQVVGGTVLQQFGADDGSVQVVDVELSLEGKSAREVRVSPGGGGKESTE